MLMLPLHRFPTGSEPPPVPTPPGTTERGTHTAGAAWTAEPQPPSARERGAALESARGTAQAALTHLAAARPRRGRAERSPALPTCLGLERIALQRWAPGSGCERQPDMIG